jgi:TolB-like protein/Flp pilus assembly protein TadD
MSRMSGGQLPKRTFFGRYQVQDLIAVSGMGVVYRAWDPKLECTVAIKVVSEDRVPDELVRHQLLTEARIASSLNHPNICTIKDVEESDGQTGIIMEFVEGQILAKMIPSRVGLPFKDVVEYGIQIAVAVSHAHDRQVIHRDIKSGNVMVTPDGRIKLLDFGLSESHVRTELPEFLETQNTARSSRVIVGTPPYWAPEILRGGQTDPRSDIWSLGVLLYEMASGRMPFEGRTIVELGAAILSEAPVPLPTHVPATLSRIIHRSLLKEIGERYQLASEVRSALELIRPPGDAQWKSTTFPSPSVVTSVAVLPLENISGIPEQEYFADGLTESLITALAKMPGLRVISRTSVMQYKRARKTLPQIVSELRVDALVTGSVLRVGDRVRIAAELIEAATDQHLWAESYERDLRDILNLQSEVAHAIAGEIRRTLSPPPNSLHTETETETGGTSAQLQEAEEFADSGTALAPSVNPEAYDLYLKGRYFWNNQITDDDFRRALGYYQRAIAIDPSSALTYAGLAISFVRLGTGEYGLVAPNDVMPKAKKAALDALALDDELADAHLALGMVKFRFEGDWQGAEPEFLRAIELKDSDAATHYMYAIYLMASGRFDDALREVKSAQDLNPLSPSIHFNLGFLLYCSRQYEEAIEQLQGTLTVHPGFALARLILGLALLQKARFGLAIEQIERALALAGPVPLWRGFLGHAYAMGGRINDARQILQDLLTETSRRFVPPTAIALVHTGLGVNDEAFLWLQKSVVEHDGLLIYLKVAAVFDKLRSDPRLSDLIDGVGLNASTNTDHGANLQTIVLDDVDQGATTGPAPKERPLLEKIRAILRRWAYVLVPAVVVTSFALAAVAFWPAHRDNIVLAVLPFNSLTSDIESQQIAGGLTEEMVSSFGSLHPNNVSIVGLPPTADLLTPSKIGKQYDCDYVLRGTVRRVGHKIAITAQLIVAADHTAAWGGSYNREIQQPEDIINIQIDIATEVRNAILSRLPKGTYVAHQVQPKAYEAYVEGRYFWGKRTTPSLQKAITYFDAAIQEEPDYAQAYAGLADCYSLLGSIPQALMTPKEAFPKAEAAAQRALQLEHDLAEAHVSLGYADLVYERDYPKAQKEFQEALRLRPAYATAHQYYGYYLTAMGRLPEAISERQVARDLDPTAPLLNSALGEAYYQARDYERAIQAYQNALNLDPGYSIALINLGRAYEQKGMYLQANGIFETMLEAAPDEPAIVALAGHDYALSGHRDRAEQLLSRLQVDAGTRYVPALYFAMIYTGLGDKDQAFRWLDKAYEENCEYLITLPTEPFADPLRRDPRFPVFLNRLGLKPIV